MILIAGCGGAPANTSTGTSPATPTDTPTSTPTTTPTASLENRNTQTNPAQTPTQTCEPDPLTASLEITFNANVPVHVTITESGAQTPVVNRTYPVNTTQIEYSEETGVFEPATDYQIIIQTNGTVQWDGTIERNADHNLLIQPNGSVHTSVTNIIESPTPYC